LEHEERVKSGAAGEPSERTLDAFECSNTLVLSARAEHEIQQSNATLLISFAERLLKFVPLDA
jgi:hypothetical protein